MILVTGGAKGLGKEIAHELKERGHEVLVHERTQGDFSTPAGTDAFVEKMKGLPITGLVNNVGQFFEGGLQETNVALWREFFESNLHAPFALISALLPTLKRVVNVGSFGLDGRAHTYAGAYHATKEGLLQLTKTFAKELAPLGITVNMVSPGYMENSVVMPKVLPMGRPARLKEVAQVVVSLFEPQFDYVTGQNIEVAGGVGL